MPGKKLLLLLGALALTAAAVTVGVVATGTEERVSAPAPQPVVSTPLDEVDTRMLTVPRASFCDAVDPVLVNRALGRGDEAAGVEPDEYANGQRVSLAPSVRDVAHEYGCTWTGGGAEARAWVFAPPVAAEQAGDLLDGVAKRKGCTSLPEKYGRPSTGQLCSVGEKTEVSYRGLFGDAWLTCTLTDTPADEPVDDARKDELSQRAGDWCAAVALAASG